MPLRDQRPTPPGKLFRAERGDDPAATAAAGLADESTGQHLQRLLSILSHELRAPLNRIQSWSHVLENELNRTLTQESGRNTPSEPAPLTQHALAGIRNGVRDQVQLIDQLLDCSRAIAGALRFDSRPTLLLPILEGAIHSAQLMAASKRIRIAAEFSASDARVNADGAGLRQAVMQLLTNAVKFAPDDSKIRLILRRDAGAVLITVADQGVGISGEVLPRLFNWFERGDSRQPGLGLGLALVRAYCESQGGEVSASSSGVGCGASFTMRFPEQGTTH
jgi:signal transduction histidine kinase